MVQNSAAIRSLMLPLEQDLMLLPGSLVAEVVSYHEPEPIVGEAPDWLLGIIDWRGQRVPLVSMEIFMGGATFSAAGSGRVAVLKVLDDHLGIQFYAVLTRQIPHLVTVGAAAMTASQAADTSRRPGVAADMLLNGEAVLIPDVAAVEAALRDHLPL